MRYRNIDILLKDRQEGKMIISSEDHPGELAEVPRPGEIVGIDTHFDEHLLVKVQAALDSNNLYQGVAAVEIYSDTVGGTKLITRGELLEFSHSKICTIRRG